MIVVEFTATPGAGKTTLLASAVAVLQEQGWTAHTVVEAARLFAGRTWIGKAINLVSPPALRRPLLWQVFSVSSFIYRLKFIARHPQLVRQVLRSQRKRPDSAGARERRTLHWFFHLAGSYEFLAAHAGPDDALVFDDGFVHRAVHLGASPVEKPDPDSVRAYLDLIPRPDILIVPRAPLEVCEERVARRGVWSHFRDRSREELAEYLANSELIVNVAAGHAKSKRWTVIEVDNGTDDLPLTIKRLRTELMSLPRPDTWRDNAAGSSALQDTTPLPRIPHLPRPSRLSEFIRSRMRPLDIQLETVNHVLDAFALEMTHPPVNLPLSRRTRNLVVYAGAKKKVLKRYRAHHEIPTLTYVHSILARLEQVGFPAPRLTTTPAGESFVNMDGGIYALFDFVEGTNYSLSFFLPAHRAILMRAAGQTLARLHHALNGFAPQGKHHLGFESQTGNWQRGLPWYTAKVEELKEKSRGLEDEQEKACADWIVQKSAYVLEELGELDVSLRRASLPRLIIHGDFGLHNLVFPKVGPAAIMDFETARLEWRLSDLVSALSRLRYVDGSYNFSSIQSFLGGYQSVFPIDMDEWQLLPSVWRFYKLRSALIYWNSFFETGGPVRKMHSARDAVWQADWVLQHPHELSGLSALSPA